MIGVVSYGGTKDQLRNEKKTGCGNNDDNDENCDTTLILVYPKVNASETGLTTLGWTLSAVG